MNMENKQPKKKTHESPPPQIKITPPPKKKAERKQAKNTQRRKNAKYFIYNQWKFVSNNRFIFLPTEDPPDLDPPEEADRQVDRVQDSVQETRGAAGGYVLSKGQSLEVQLRHLR